MAEDDPAHHNRTSGSSGRAPRAPVELAFLEDAYRKTVITDVSAVHGQGLLLGKSIYYAPSRQYGHAHPADRGHLLVAGHKLKIERVAWRSDGLAHVVRGPVPKRGDRVLAHLDWDRRHLAMRAHAAMHLIVHAVVAERRGAFVDVPEVKNGGHVRATLRLKERGPKGVADLLKRVNELAAGRHPVTTRWMPRDAAAQRATPQHVGVADVAPGEPVLRVVETGDVCRVPCDAPTLKDTREIGRVVARDVLERGDSTRVMFRVEDAA